MSIREQATLVLKDQIQNKLGLKRLQLLRQLKRNES